MKWAYQGVEQYTNVSITIKGRLDWEGQEDNKRWFIESEDDNTRYYLRDGDKIKESDHVAYDM